MSATSVVAEDHHQVSKFSYRYSLIDWRGNQAPLRKDPEKLFIYYEYSFSPFSEEPKAIEQSKCTLR
jgi:hypothetical protein